MSRIEVLQLYKQLMREGQKFSSYNFRHYAVRRIRDAFKENKALRDPEKISSQMKFGGTNLNMLKRQVIISQLYQSNKLVIEGLNKKVAA